MKFNATIVTDETQSIVASSKSVVGQTPAPRIPQLLGVLIFQRPNPALMPAPSPAGTVTAEQAWVRLPQTANTISPFQANSQPCRPPSRV
jgi:hypothetical protein